MKNVLFLVFVSFLHYSWSQTPCPTAVFSGTGTFYTSDPLQIGACSFPGSENTMYFCAMNEAQYNTASFCGTCLEITGNAGTEIVYVTDMTPGGLSGNLDMNQAAFEATVGAASLGSGSISWRQVNCPFASPVSLTTGAGTNPYYIEYTIHQHVNEIQNVEIYVNSSWQGLQRQTNNVWTAPFALNNVITCDVRITDLFGQTVLVSGVSNNGAGSYNADGNFSPCSAAGITDEGIETTLNRSGNILTFLMKDGYKIELYNMAGQLIISQGSNVLDISGQPSGIYFVSIESPEGHFQRMKIFL